ncbi:MAG TPA: hypothetical protein VML75_11965 [Kofleriaceae bacterium]|nr:hypothetical protein [Kofleriaceae bacterium]
MKALSLIGSKRVLGRRGLQCLISIGLLVGFAGVAAPQDKAAAEVAFEAGRQLMADGSYAEACAKFQQSVELDLAIGTLLNLANCHEKLGMTATAWAEFTEAANIAKRTGQVEYGAEAKRRADFLQPNLSYLLIEYEGPRPDQLEVRRGEKEITGLLGAPFPVDPGEQPLRARAPGYEEWAQSVMIASGGGTQRVAISLRRASESGEVRAGNDVDESVPSSAGEASRASARRFLAIGELGYQPFDDGSVTYVSARLGAWWGAGPLRVQTSAGLGVARVSSDFIDDSSTILLELGVAGAYWNAGRTPWFGGLGMLFLTNVDSGGVGDEVIELGPVGGLRFGNFELAGQLRVNVTGDPAFEFYTFAVTLGYLFL